MSARRSAAGLAALAAVLLAAAPVRAQVGHTPQASPYRDLEHSHEITPIVGVMQSQKDPAGVAWRGGPMVGVRYEYRLGGPAYLVGRVAGIQSERTVIDPSRPEATRTLGDRTGIVMAADVGLALSLTGHKTWHGISPVLHGGLGVVADFRKADEGGYTFGTPFALPVGAGLRWTPGGRLQLRVDATDYLYRISYPDRFYRATEDVPALLEQRVARSRWTHNGAFTVGLSYLFGR